MNEINHVKSMRALKQRRYAQALLTRMEIQLAHIRALVPWPALHHALERDIDTCRQIAREKGWTL